MSDYRILIALDLKIGNGPPAGEAQRYGRVVMRESQIIHDAAPDPTLVGYIKSPSTPDPEHESQEEMIPDSHAKALRSEHEQTKPLPQRCAPTEFEWIRL